MSKIEVDAIDKQSGSTLTLGGSGTAVTLACGATQSGFGRTGTVDWQTTPKTATFTAVSGEGYFANTTGSAFNMNLPAGTAGAIVSVADYAATWDSNALTVVPNGSDKIGGVNANTILNTEGQSVTFVFVDSTQGWINTMDSTSNARGAAFVTATGGTITTVCTDYKVHTFTGPGTFTVCSAGNSAGSNTIEYLVVAGGGAGGADLGGAGGAGGFRTVYPSPATGGLPVTATGYPITVGAGGAPQSSPNPSGGGRGNSGSNSVFTGSSTITSAGGGGGGGAPEPMGEGAGANGGSGGGGSGYWPVPTGSGGTGNTPPVTPPQGNNGGAGGNGGPSYPGGGGGGAGAVGTTPPNSSHQEVLVEQELNLILIQTIIIGQVVEEVALMMDLQMVVLVVLVVEEVVELILLVVVELVGVVQLIQELLELQDLQVVDQLLVEQVEQTLVVEVVEVDTEELQVLNLLIKVEMADLA